MPLEFILSQKDGRPMYLQIIEQIKGRISIGDWPIGSKLPSIRELAVATKVSVITVKRAYQELEREGVIVTQQGKGSFIAEIDELGAKLKHQEMQKHLEQAILMAKELGLTSKDLSQLIHQIMINKNQTGGEIK